MAFTTKENEELEVAPPQPLTIPVPEREHTAEPLTPTVVPEEEPIPVPA